MIPVRVWIENLDEFTRGWRASVQQIVIGCHTGVELGVKVGVDTMLSTRRWKDRTGKTRDATFGLVTSVTPSGAEGVMECQVQHASYLKDGTPPHEIWPKEGHGFIGPVKPGHGRRSREDIGTYRISLRWYDDPESHSGIHFAGHVNHPGTVADAFWNNGLEACEGVIVEEIEKSVFRAQRVLEAA